MKLPNSIASRSSAATGAAMNMPRHHHDDPASVQAAQCWYSARAPLRCGDRRQPNGDAEMRVHNLYTDANGQSHFRDIEIEWVEESRAGKLSRRLPATGIIFREVQPDYDLDWHPAPRRQYIINLDAGVQITASDGEARVIGAGEVILVEDTSGKGHLSKAVEGKVRNCIFVPVD
jgi:hypothetical protein